MHQQVSETVCTSLQFFFLKLNKIYHYIHNSCLIFLLWRTNAANLMSSFLFVSIPTTIYHMLTMDILPFHNLCDNSHFFGKKKLPKTCKRNFIHFEFLLVLLLSLSARYNSFILKGFFSRREWEKRNCHLPFQLLKKADAKTNKTENSNVKFERNKH